MEKLSFGRKPKGLVVGAGPIGLAAALDFANFEIETLVVDELSEINRASKAICWSQRSLEILNRVGLAEQLITKAAHGKKGVFLRLKKKYTILTYKSKRVLRLLPLSIYSNIMLNSF